MNVKSMKEALGYECLSGESWLDRPVEGAYQSDLLSDVMGKAQADGVDYLSGA